MVIQNNSICHSLACFRVARFKLVQHGLRLLGPARPETPLLLFLGERGTCFSISHPSADALCNRMSASQVYIHLTAGGRQQKHTFAPSRSENAHLATIFPASSSTSWMPLWSRKWTYEPHEHLSLCSLFKRYTQASCNSYNSTRMFLEEYLYLTAPKDIAYSYHSSPA